MDKILEVKDLKISFRTASGTLKAVRDISFDLERGKTLAIVGESGSGKSVTSKAILGILAGNSIVEGGEIFYDGMDLLKISEEEMCKIRGDRISMIFQDPLSSLNPIVKIGRQITEAMLLKNKGNRRRAKKDFNNTLAILKKHMESALAGDPRAARIGEMISTFDRFNIQGIKLENSYQASHTAAEELLADIGEFRFMLEKRQKQDVKARLRDFEKALKTITDPFLVAAYQARLEKVASQLEAARGEYHEDKNAIKEGRAQSLPANAINALDDLTQLLGEMTGQERPNFFCIGYYKMCNPNEKLSSQPIETVNAMTRKYLDDNFMLEFLEMEKAALKQSFESSQAKKRALISKLSEARAFYAAGGFDKSAAIAKCKELSTEVEASIDLLEIVKDSVAYTFRSSISDAVNKYFYFKKRNPKEEARYARQTKRREALIARGKTVDWKVTPKVVYELDDLAGNITAVIDRLTQRYTNSIEAASHVDYDERSVAMVDFFKDKASQVVYRITKGMAKNMAIKLMEEVGIPEPHIRYYQYPFEFSGGMRQRIVIAIALAANPDILICDEPTTALDVTIQAQILELINKLKDERNLSVIFITHDLGVVANMADDIAVMYAGKIVEHGTADDIFYDPHHPYTWALLSSMPDLDTKEKLDAIPGTPPNMIYPPQGDAFAERNKYAMKIDFEEQPPKFKISETHWAATWLLHPDAPKVEKPKIISERIARMKAKAEGDNA